MVLHPKKIKLFCLEMGLFQKKLQRQMLLLLQFLKKTMNTKSNMIFLLIIQIVLDIPTSMSARIIL